MNYIDPIVNLNRLKEEETWQKLGAEEIYSIYMRDFLVMPDMDFREIAKVDMDIRVLFN
jgi:hypothetical protein